MSSLSAVRPSSTSAGVRHVHAGVDHGDLDALAGAFGEAAAEVVKRRARAGGDHRGIVSRHGSHQRVIPTVLARHNASMMTRNASAARLIGRSASASKPGPSGSSPRAICTHDTTPRHSPRKYKRHDDLRGDAELQLLHQRRVHAGAVAVHHERLFVGEDHAHEPFVEGLAVPAQFFGVRAVVKGGYEALVGGVRQPDGALVRAGALEGIEQQRGGQRGQQFGEVLRVDQPGDVGKARLDARGERFDARIGQDGQAGHGGRQKAEGRR